jgi:photosystem II stability/assembly factor-like uncharacterized protein
LDRDRDARRFLACLTAFVLSMSVIRIAAAGVNQWTSTGPEGGWTSPPAFHPTRNGVLFVAASRVYRSTDGGAHWVAVSEDSPVSGSFVFDPNNPDRILVSGQPVLRSIDGGASFTEAAYVPGNLQVSPLAITSNGGVVYAGSGSKVYRSADFGMTWEERAVGLPNSPDGVTGLAISPADSSTLYMSLAAGGLYKSNDAGANWNHITTFPGGANAIAINPANAVQMLVAGGISSAMWRSTDAGANWTAVAANAYFSGIAYDPLVVNRVVSYEYRTRRLYVSNDGGGAWVPGAVVPASQGVSGEFSRTTAGVFGLGGSAGVFLSTDAGHTVAYSNSGMIASDLRNIAASRSAPYRVYASFYGGPDGLHQRVSGGWQATNTAQFYGLLPERNVVSAIGIDPLNSSIVYAGGFGGLAKSTDAGGSWSRVWNGDFAYAMAIDPADPRILYVVATTTGVARSADGGTTWSYRNNGLPVIGTSVPIYNIKIDPTNTSRLYAFEQSTGDIYRTVDAGLNWSRINGLQTGEIAYTVAFDPLDQNLVYLGAQSGIYRSGDGGSTWVAMSVPLGTLGVTSVLIDPAVPSNITLICASGTVGVVRTVDYGTTWERVSWDEGSRKLITGPIMGVLDPAQPGNLIVGAYHAGMREFQIAPDLAISISGVSGRMQPGSTPTVRISVQNKPTSPFGASDATVTLSLPAILTPGTASASRGSCVRVGQSLTCTLGAMKVGETAQIDLPLNTVAGTGTISATVQGREADLAPTDNSAALSVIVQPYSDLRVTLPAPVTTNHYAVVPLDVMVTNLGPQDANNVRAAFTLPAGFVLAPGSSCTTSGTTVACLVATLSRNATALVQIVSTAFVTGQYPVSVAVDSDSFDPDSSNNSATTTVTVRRVTDLAVVLGAPPAAVAVGQAGTATATITNGGPDPVDVTVVSLSGSNLKITAASAAGGSCAISSGGANCSLGAMVSGSSRAVDVTFSPVATGAAQLSAAVNSEAQESAAGDNTASRTLTGTASANLGVTLAAAPAAINRQSSTLLTARVTNAGPTEAPAARAVFTVPAGLGATSASPSVGTCTMTASSVDCALGSMNNGEVATVDVTATGAVTGSSSVTAGVSTTAFDAVAGNNTASAAVLVRGLTDLAISMTALPASLQAGQTANTTVTVMNNGPDEANIAVANLSTGNLDVQSAVPSAGTCSISSTSTDCSLGVMAAGSSRTIAITVAARSVGAASLSVTTSYEGGERSGTDNTATGSIIVSAPPATSGGGGGGSSGGGGGALGGWGLLAMLAWSLRSATRQRANHA